MSMTKRALDHCFTPEPEWCASFTLQTREWMRWQQAGWELRQEWDRAAAVADAERRREGEERYQRMLEDHERLYG